MPGRSSRAARHSAGLLLYRQTSGELEVLLVHPGGPYWMNKDGGAWSVPKGEYEEGEEPVAAARREFTEELGTPPPEGEPLELGEIRQKGGKFVRAWAMAGELDTAAIASNTFSMEWPRGSGRMREFPEVDRAQWFSLAEAAEKINPAQSALLNRLAEAVGR